MGLLTSEIRDTVLGMCGRYASTRSATDLAFLFGAEDETGDGLAADYNIAPTDPVAMIRIASSAARVVSPARWGLVPPWAKDTGGAARMINARVETAATSPAFRRSFERRRCLVPADGWYEWVRADGRKQPYFMTRRDGGVLAFAGLWSVWGDGLLTCSILTTAAVGDLVAVHDRMPVLMPPDRWDGWLSAGADPAAVLAPATQAMIADLEIRPVGLAVGDVRNDGPGLIERSPGPSMALLDAESADLTLF